VDPSKVGDSRTAQLPAWLARERERWVIALRVHPAARRTGTVGPYGDRLKIAITAPADAGRANAQLVEFIAAKLGVTQAAVELISGTTSRDKRIAVPASLRADQIVAAMATPKKEAGR
jgi:uncharacterized protein (TIGR00251 family)